MRTIYYKIVSNRAVKKLKNNNALGIDAIPTGLFKHGGETVEKLLLLLFGYFPNTKNLKRMGRVFNCAPL